jgi:hypothetical protein
MRNHLNVRLAIALATLGAAVLSACGAAGKTNGGATQVNQSLAFATCMRAHGVPSFPDPSANGGLRITPGSGIEPQSPAFQKAQRACGQAPGGGGPPTMSESERLAALGFAKCMRGHGEPDFPDPTLTAPSGAKVLLALRGMVFSFGAGVDLRSPAFRLAARECGLRLP